MKRYGIACIISAVVGVLCCSAIGYRLWIQLELTQQGASAGELILIYKALAKNDVPRAQGHLESALAVRVVFLQTYGQRSYPETQRVLAAVKQVFSNTPPANPILRSFVEEPTPGSTRHTLRNE